jgi:hypothetical protein
VQAFSHPNGDHRQAVAGGGVPQLSDPFAARPRRKASVDPLADPQDVAAVDHAGLVDEDDVAVPLQRVCDRRRLRAARLGARPRDHRHGVEHDGSIFDENRIGQVRRIRQALDAAAERLERAFVVVVLPHGPRVVDRRTFSVRQLAADDARRDGACEGDQHKW